MIIYHTSDMHDHRGFVQPLRALRAQAPGLLFDCGDSLRGSQTMYHRREPIIAEIDAAGYDAQGMGNREFHYLYSAVRARAKQMHHPLLCSNLVDTRNRPLPFLRELRLSYEGAKLYIIALLVVQYPERSFWERIFGWRFEDPFAVVARHAALARDDETLVVLSHLGLRMDRRLGATAPRIDLLLGGHSHDTLEQPEFAGEVPIIHAGPYARHVSRSTLTASSSGRMRLVDFSLLPLLPT